MSDCCSPGNGFPNAQLMQQLALNHPVIWEEICKIQQEILSASSQCQPGSGKMCAIIGGNTPMTFSSGVSNITVLNGGLGYLTDTPSVKFVPPVGVMPTVIAEGTVQTNGGIITGITITEEGEGYIPVPATLAVSSVNGAGAVLEPMVNSAGSIVGVNIVSGGADYSVNDDVIATRAVASNPAYTAAVLRVSSVGVTGGILSIEIISGGSGFQNSVVTAEIVSSLNPLVSYPTGAGFASTTFTDINGSVSQVFVNNGGAGYSDFKPYLVISDPGTGAITNVTLTGTAVSTVTVTSPGTNYTPSATGIILNPPSAPLPNPPSSPAIVSIGISENTFGTNPELYWQVWTGAATDKQIDLQMSKVISHFTSLGYTIKRQTNPDTGSTIQWLVCW